ncbi:type-F conjugative transfer system protein TraW [Photobacterium damselae]|uniref:type-F conjugative transfer system protein TraW n=1 Tax=Photobacterium damselae TaxID=38293 RepID=UPI0040679CA9
MQGKQHLLFALLLFFTLPLPAKNLGVIAPTFPIAEMDMLDWIMARLRHYEATGELDAMKAKFQEQVKQSVIRPTPVKGITTTTKPNRFFVDPTLTLAQDIKDAKGNVLFPKGLKVNPFDAKTWPNGKHLPHFSLSKQLVFLDGDDMRQLHFAKRFMQEEAAKPNPLRIKWILTNGEPEKVHRFLQAPVYFDQQGNITRKFKIKHVPSQMKQVGTQWQVQEFDVSLESDAISSIIKNAPEVTVTHNSPSK